MVVGVFHLAVADDYPDVVRVVVLIEDFDPGQLHPVDGPAFAGIADAVVVPDPGPAHVADHLALDHPDQNDLLQQYDHLVRNDRHPEACRPALLVRAARVVADHRL